jgi:hypothetical protein
LFLAWCFFSSIRVNPGPYIVTSPENTYPRGKHGEIKVHRKINGWNALTLWTPSAVVPLVYCRIRTILHIYTRQSVPKTDCQPRRRSILDSFGLQRVFWWPVQFFPGVCQIWFHCAFHPFIFQKSGKSTIRTLAVPRHFVSCLVFFF